MNLKALILCAGKGTRLRPLTDSIAKPLVPVANRPILTYILDQIKNLDIHEIGIVVSPYNIEQISSFVGDGSRWNAQIKYVVQKDAGGLAHAVITAEEYLGNSSFLLFLGDNLIEDDLRECKQRFHSGAFDAFILLKEVTDPRHFGVAELDLEGKVKRLVEKPKEPKSNLALIGVYFFTPHIHTATHTIKPSARGELEITDAIQWLVDNGSKVGSHTVCGWWLDTGKREDLLTANRLILEGYGDLSLKGEIDSNSKVSGRVDIGENAKIRNSTVRGPVSIAEGCLIEGSHIGPFTSIGAKSVIENSSLENTIILENCRISNVSDLRDSIIGNFADITGNRENKKAIKVFIGSYSKIEVR